MKRSLGCAMLWALVAALLTPAAWAQEGQPDEVGDRGDRGGRRERREHRERREERARINPLQYARMLEGVKEEIMALELDEEQAEEVNILFEEHLGRLREQMEEMRESRREHSDRVQELVEELRAAQEDGDQEAAEEIRRQIAEMRQNPEGPEYTHEKLFESVRELLYEDQVDRFDEITDRFEEQVAGPQRKGSGLRRLRQAVAMLELSDEQRLRTREIFVEAMREMRGRMRDPEKMQDLEESVRRDIMAELDEDQAAELERKLEELSKREEQMRERRGREDRPERARPGEEEKPQEEAPHEEPAEEPVDDGGGSPESDTPYEDDYDY